MKKKEDAVKGLLKTRRTCEVKLSCSKVICSELIIIIIIIIIIILLCLCSKHKHWEWGTVIPSSENKEMGRNPSLYHGAVHTED